jgi:hypothetical protein
MIPCRIKLPDMKSVSTQQQLHNADLNSIVGLLFANTVVNPLFSQSFVIQAGQLPVKLLAGYDVSLGQLQELPGCFRLG